MSSVNRVGMYFDRAAGLLTAQGLATEETRIAVDRYWRAKQRRDALYGRLNALFDDDSTPYEETSRCEDWAEQATIELADAERSLIRAALLWGGLRGVDLMRCEKKVFRPRGFILDGVLYLASPDYDNEQEEGSGGDSSGVDQMHLFILDAASIATVEG